ncbi:hypothetical protein OIU35_00575 [Boseaceae bacterium BT-24-1]|nr:hypothetical protein [Boseaceae bacterium BT-24-1]
MNDLKAISASGIIIGPLGSAQRRSQSQAPDPSHAIDADSHVALCHHRQCLLFDMSLDIEMIDESIMSSPADITRLAYDPRSAQRALRLHRQFRPLDHGGGDHQPCRARQVQGLQRRQ